MQETSVYEAHPTDPDTCVWTGYLDVRILHNKWFSYLTNQVQSLARAHFEKQSLESLGTFADGFCAKDVYKRVCIPYVEESEEVS